MGSLSSLVCTGVLRNKMIQYDNMSQYICICIPICFWSEFVLKQSKKVSPPKKHKTSLVRLLGILWIVKRSPKKACVLRFRSLGPKHGPTVLRCNSLEKEGFWQKEGSGLWSKGVERCEGHPVWTVFLFFRYSNTEGWICCRMSKKYQILLQEYSTKSMSFLETIEVAKLVGFSTKHVG